MTVTQTYLTERQISEMNLNITDADTYLPNEEKHKQRDDMTNHMLRTIDTNNSAMIEVYTHLPKVKKYKQGYEKCDRWDGEAGVVDHPYGIHMVHLQNSKQQHAYMNYLTRRKKKEHSDIMDNVQL